MAQKTDAQLQIERAVIENETVAGANTVVRVGNMFEDIIDSKPNNTRTVNSQPLSADVVLTKSDVGLGNVPNLAFSGSNTGDQDISGIATNTTAIAGINPTRVSVSVSVGTLTLDLNSYKRRKFLLGTVSADFIIAFSNTTNAEEFDLDFAITGTVAITMPSTVRMQGYEVANSRWVHSTKILTVIGTTASPFTLTFRYDGTIYRCACSDAFIIA